MRWFIGKLREWHWLHTWSSWISQPVKYIAYPWTQPGCYAHTEKEQERSCGVCGKTELRRIA